MQSLIETLETRVLGCWRGVLLPAAPDAALPKDAARLHPELRGCGWRDEDPALLRVRCWGRGLAASPRFPTAQHLLSPRRRC